MVNNTQYVYWYLSGHEFHLYLSPKNNKRMQIKIVFQFDFPAESKYMFSAFYKISANHCNAKTTACIAEPQFVSAVLSYLLSTHMELFEAGKPTVLDGIAVLHEMGYTELEPIWILEW